MDTYQKMEAAVPDVVDEMKSTSSITKFVVLPLLIAGILVVAISKNTHVSLSNGVDLTNVMNLSKKSANSKFLEKYGADDVYENFFSKGSIPPASYQAPMVLKKTMTGVDRFYATVTAYDSEDCSGDEIFKAGTVSGECVNGILIDCTVSGKGDLMVVSNEYSSPDCSGRSINTVVVYDGEESCLNGLVSIDKLTFLRSQFSI